MCETDDPGRLELTTKKEQISAWAESVFVETDRLPTAKEAAAEFGVTRAYAQSILTLIRLEKFGE